MFDRVYVEIGNMCNMKCSFCSGTRRAPRQMTTSEFELVCTRLSGYTENLYFHVMGEPLLHPELDSFIKIAGKHGYKVSITTNGTLLDRRADVLLSNAEHIHRVSISLHAPEGNGINGSLKEYLDSVIGFAKRFSALDKNVIFRLWNLDSLDRSGENSQNSAILGTLKEEYAEEWTKRYSGYRLAYRTFLELDEIFTWPSESSAEPKDEGRCHALKRQIAVLCDGTVVPCCLDSEGQIPLGNIFSEELSEILSGNVATMMKKGFDMGKMMHPVCKKCTYARRFSVKYEVRVNVYSASEFRI